MVDSGSDIIFLAKEVMLLLLETIFAKESKNKLSSSGKTPRLVERATHRIKVRTEWQFGKTSGNTVCWCVIGNGLAGDSLVHLREIQPNL